MRYVEVPEIMKVYSDALDQAMNSFRKQALAFQSMHAPTPCNVITGHQVNVGQQQIVSNGDSAHAGDFGKHASANELGSGVPNAQAALSLESRRTQKTSSNNPSKSAVGSVDRASNSARKAARQPERTEARVPNSKGGSGSCPSKGGSQGAPRRSGRRNRSA